MGDRPNGEYTYHRNNLEEETFQRKMENVECDEKEQQSDKAGEYVRELLQEKVELDSNKWPNAIQLIDQEIQKTQAIGKPLRDPKYVDIYRDKPIRVSVKVLVPIREHPKFNFVGKLLGPKGNTLKRLQEETLCKMAVLGKGSMKDRQKEDECRLSLDPKYAHLSDDLHVEITAIAQPAEAYARIAFALAEISKYLIPDNNDMIRQKQMREMEMTMNEEPSGNNGPAIRGHVGSGGMVRSNTRIATPRPGRGGLLPAPTARGPISRGAAPVKTKVLSILDRARVAMDPNYGYETASAPSGNRGVAHHDYDYNTVATTSSNSRYNDRHYASSAGYTTYDYEDEIAPQPSHDYYESSDYSAG
ncbi:KH domain-containing, RNA-binding, signal transduction-associated protein 3-like isoform X2 [Prorops nasuta]|uniref:KH domain-containing, RNA-binding, signal transduction-associated protein 3-like isoform X2 n=1 Tax=Prorops nasuta TaxID=863751 RepID=UPI0034CFCB99